MKFAMLKRRALLFAAPILALALAAPAAAESAENFPSKPIRIIVGFGPGGGNDLLARVVAQKMQEDFKQPVVVENKPGAGAIIATEYVAKSPPDGYTLLMGASGAMSINPAVYAKLSYSPTRDFVPISMIASFPLILVADPKIAVKSASDLVAYAKANPAKANYASSSAAFQLATELFKMKTGAPIEHVAYKSSGESVRAVVSGEVLMTISDPAPVAGQIKGGQVRALAVTAKKRMADFPDVPTLEEAGVPDIEVLLWTGLWAPAATPPAIRQKLEQEVMRVVRLPEISARLRTLAVDPVGSTSEEFASALAVDIARWTAVAKASNIKLD